MLSIQGLILMFMFGVAMTMLVSAMWLGYTEYKLKQKDDNERLSQELLQEIFKDEYIDAMDEHDRYQDMQEYRARMNEDGG